MVHCHLATARGGSIGVNTGEVVALLTPDGTYSLSGSLVHLAARLEQAAEPNTVFISGRTFRAVPQHANARPCGQLSFKGFDTPIETWELIDVAKYETTEAPNVFDGIKAEITKQLDNNFRSSTPCLYGSSLDRAVLQKAKTSKESKTVIGSYTLGINPRRHTTPIPNHGTFFARRMRFSSFPFAGSP